MDANQTSSTTFLMGFTKAWRRFLAYHSAMLIALTIVIIIGNLVTLVALVRSRPLRRKQNVLIGSLAVADLLVGIVTCVTSTLVGLKILPLGWNPLTLLTAVLTTVSLAHMVFIGVNRFIAVVLPLRYSSLVTKNIIILMVILVWLIPAAFMIPVQVHAFERGMLPNAIPFVDWSLAINSIIWILLLCVSLVILYSKILMETRAQAKKVQSWQLNTTGDGTAQQNTAQSTGNQKKFDRNQKSTRLVLIIMSVALLLNMPYLVYSILLLNGAPFFGVPMLTLLAIAQHCYLANSGINIFIYALFTSDFRKAYGEIFCFRCCTKNGNENRNILTRETTNNTNDTNITNDSNVTENG